MYFVFHALIQVAIACIQISSKYNENEEDVPELAVLEDIVQQEIKKDALLNYELWVRNTFML